MNPSVWTALQPLLAQGARDVLRTLGTILLTHGVITNGSVGVEAFIGAGMTLFGILWGWWTTTGYLQAAALLKKLTAQHSVTEAVTTAKAMPPATTQTVNSAIIGKVVPTLLIAFALSLLLSGGSAFAQTTTKRPGLAVTGDPVADIKTDFASAGIKAPNIKPGDACSYNLFAALDPKTFVTQIQNCISADNSILLPDVQKALDSATDAKDGTATQCLTPALAIVKAAIITPGDPTATPPVPAQTAGIITLFQKFREFVNAGGPAACKIWVNTTITGANPL